ncbi:putative methyltransferase-domain-containing protein [Hysterangium stoloniferum]|nr:putative methyltransferase-domain-containing protein [Hysterangium stoloniferum]
MFYYLSFLRPLPNTSGAQATVSITPQIANDLRTCHFEDTLDIFYTWCPSLTDVASPSAASTARKLTTWRTSSMYKNIPINLPPMAKSGQLWRLALSCPNPQANDNFVINLASENFGKRPLPVISMPVRLEPLNKSNNIGKQEQIERLYSVPLNHDGEQRNVVLCIREQTSFDLDKKIWDSGLALSSWLTRLIGRSKSSSSLLIKRLDDMLTSSQSTLRIIELGTGSGIVSICLSALIDSFRPSLETLVWATDLPSAMELIEHNISTNKNAYSSINLRPLILDWDSGTLPALINGKVDLIVMADVTYNTASFPSLVQTLDRLNQESRSGSEPSSDDTLPTILLAYKQRDSAERDLWGTLKTIGINLVLVDRVLGAGAEPVEIWMSDSGIGAV